MFYIAVYFLISSVVSFNDALFDYDINCCIIKQNMTYVFEHYEAIVGAFEHLRSCLNALCRHIHDDLKHYPVWVEKGGVFHSDRDRLIYALKHFAPTPGIAPQSTWVCPGAVGCNHTTITLIQAVNQAKDDFKAVAERYRCDKKANPTKAVREVLAKKGYGWTKLKQICRHIHYVDYSPNRVAWTKGKAYSQVVITPEQARKELLKVGRGEHIDIQLAKLDMLSPHEKLVKCRAMKPYWVVNVARRLDGQLHNQKLATSLPLFFLYDKMAHAPIVCFSHRADNRRVRSDKLIEDEPFLKSIKVYRYKANPRSLIEQH